MLTPEMLLLLRPAFMLLIPLLLAIIPVKVTYKPLMMLGFALWATGGLMLLRRGISLMQIAETSTMMLIVGVIVAIGIGFVKGKLVLSKACIRNILRLQTLKEPVRLINVYPLRSWILIGVMLSISVVMTLLDVPPYWRSLINLGIGMALLVSSTLYLRYINAMNPYLNKE